MERRDDSSLMGYGGLNLNAQTEIVILHYFEKTSLFCRPTLQAKMALLISDRAKVRGSEFI